MKTLYILPNEGYDTAYYLCDVETGEVLASHFCSHQGFAPGDLYNDRPERKEAFTKKYNDSVQVKFFNEQSGISEDEILELNKEWAEREGDDEVDN